MKKAILVSSLVLVFILAVCLVYFFVTISLTASSDSLEKYFIIESGQGVDMITKNLAEEGLIKNKFIFKVYLKISGSSKSIKAGEYFLRQNLNIIEMAKALSEGVKADEKIVRILEGWSNKEIDRYLTNEKVFTEGSFLESAKATDSREIVSNKTYDFFDGKPSDAGLEGYLFPDTYRIFKSAVPNDLIEKMLDNFDEKLTSDLRAEIKNQGKTIFEVLTMASIVEEEGRDHTDRQKIAGIFWKRIEISQPLQSDATVNYVTGKKTTTPTYNDLAQESAYNTYINYGLPPGPICNPSLDSIKAAIYPETTPYLYFLNTPDGEVIFSETYDEHLINKAKYY